MRYFIACLLILNLSLPLLASAQEPPVLDETFEIDAYSFNYPRDWERAEPKLGILDLFLGDIEDKLVFDVPIASTGEQGNGQGFGIAAEGMQIAALADLEQPTDQTLEAYTETLLAVFLGDDSLFSSTEKLAYVLNDQPLQVIYLGSDLGLLDVSLQTLELGEGQFFTLILAGNFEQITLASPLGLEVLNTFRLADDARAVKPLALSVPLELTYTREDQTATFDYPDGWTVQEAEGYALVIEPNQRGSLGISLEGYVGRPDAPDQAVGMMELIEANVAGSGASDDITPITPLEVNGKPAAYLVADDGSGTLAMFMAVEVGGDMVALVSLISEAQTFERFRVVAVSVAGTVRLPEK